MEENNQERYNMEICPNCLEANEADLAVCKYCGMPLRPVDDSAEIPEVECDGTLSEENSPEEKPEGTLTETEKPKEEKRGFRYAMRYLGIYVIVVAVEQMFSVLKTETDPSQRKLGILANVIYILAGILMAYPILGDYLKKRKSAEELPEEETEDEENGEPEFEEETEQPDSDESAE